MTEVGLIKLPRKPNDRPKIEDVAKLSGLSITTVSMVLNNRPNTRLSPEARSRVLESATALNYRPNIAAKSLKTSKTQMIGFVSDEVATTRFASGLIRGALNETLISKYVMLVMETQGDYSIEEETFAALLDRQVNHVIVASMRAREIKLPPISANMRVVMLNATNILYPLTVLPDELTGGQTVVTALMKRGSNQRIALIGKNRRVEESIYDSITIPRRMMGIKEKLKNYGLEIEIEIETDQWDPADGFVATQKLLKMNKNISSIICMNDRLAFGAYQALTAAGKRIPEDISIVSFDNDSIASYMKPGLTTVALPHEEMGAQAVKLLLGNASAETVLVPMPLIERESV